MTKEKCRCFMLVLLLLPLLPLSAESGPGQSPLSARLIVVGPNDPVYTYWGHIGIAIYNAESGEDMFYDFGNFSFYSENFYRNFIAGRMLYLGLKTPLELVLDYYMSRNSTLTLYPLNLNSAELERLQERLEWWVLPENHEYLYDYFYQNCSTIIRDVLDEAMGGALKAATGDITPCTFRHLARTGAHESLGSEILLHYLLGPAQDRKITRWEWMFLPQAVADIGMEFTWTGEDGQVRTLLGSPEVLRDASRPPVPDRSRVLWPLMLLAGLILAALWSVIRRFLCVRDGWTLAGSLARTAITLLLGIPGLILAFLMIFTDHAASYNNLNVGFTLPTVLFGLIFLVRMRDRSVLSKRRTEVVISWVWTLNLAALAVTMLLRLSGLSSQNTFAFWAFALPLVWTASRPGLWLEEKFLGRI